jgi:hypothetical protein
MTWRGTTAATQRGCVRAKAWLETFGLGQVGSKLGDLLFGLRLVRTRSRLVQVLQQIHHRRSSVGLYSKHAEGIKATFSVMMLAVRIWST